MGLLGRPPVGMGCREMRRLGGVRSPAGLVWWADVGGPSVPHPGGGLEPTVHGSDVLARGSGDVAVLYADNISLQEPRGHSTGRPPVALMGDSCKNVLASNPVHSGQ